MVADQVAKLPAPWPKYLGRVEESLLAQQVRDARLAAAVAADNPGNLEVTEQLQSHWKALLLPPQLLKVVVTPGLGKVTECIPYVRQDQVPHMQ
jgi:hypothetical protein